jgi:hypothetical protein
MWCIGFKIAWDFNMKVVAVNSLGTSMFWGVSIEIGD